MPSNSLNLFSIYKEIEDGKIIEVKTDSSQFRTLIKKGWTTSKPVISEVADEVVVDKVKALKAKIASEKA